MPPHLHQRRRCGSPCLRHEDFCYYHHTTRPPVSPAERELRQRLRGSFALPNPEDRSAIQHSIGEVIQRIACNDIDPRRAGLLLYGLQIASLNLPRERPAAGPALTVEKVTLDPELGHLAPRAEFSALTEAEDPALRYLLELGKIMD